MALRLESVIGNLPSDLDTMSAEACAEGYRFIDRLAREWLTRTTRFDRAGEALLAAYLDDALAGIGGLTLDPVVPGALRMRRFFVRPPFRRHGIGRKLVGALLEHARPTARSSWSTPLLGR
jgi:GNAT superfamily N-acetyltransferase